MSVNEFLSVQKPRGGGWTKPEALEDAPEAELEDDEEPTEEEKGTNTPAFKTARALLELARRKNRVWQSTFERDWQYLMGENHFDAHQAAPERRRRRRLARHRRPRER